MSAPRKFDPCPSLLRMGNLGARVLAHPDPCGRSNGAGVAPRAARKGRGKTAVSFLEQDTVVMVVPRIVRETPCLERLTDGRRGSSVAVMCGERGSMTARHRVQRVEEMRQGSHGVVTLGLKSALNWTSANSPLAS